jgi:hypothetical protein
MRIIQEAEKIFQNTITLELKVLIISYIETLFSLQYTT